MKTSNGMFSEAFASFSDFAMTCCGAIDEQPSRYRSEKPFAVLDDQPSVILPPSAEPIWQPGGRDLAREQAPRRKRQSSSQDNFSVRRGLSSRPSSSRRPQISSPSDFRHVYSESFHFPNGQSQIEARPRSFRPLELNIYHSDNHLSPILSHFDYPSPPVTPPQRAITHSPGSGSSHSLSHERSYSSMSFHIPRKAVNTGSVFDSPRSDVIIKKPSPARVRAHTSPERGSPIMDNLIEKVANGMLEKDRLQKQIDEVAERQSTYVNSRPSTAHSIRTPAAKSGIEMEPMPEIPALPPDAPSFSERLSSDRPSTAPPRAPVHIPLRGKSFTEEAAVFNSPGRRVEGRPPPPPLPLRLRPPLRKKKSFSHVSNWLGFASIQSHSRDISLESITTDPLPVQAKDGFYQVATPTQVFQSTRRSSFDSDATVSDWTSSDDEGKQTVPTSWSPSSSTTVKAVDPRRTVELGVASDRESVGVAF